MSQKAKLNKITQELIFWAFHNKDSLTDKNLERLDIILKHLTSIYRSI